MEIHLILFYRGLCSEVPRLRRLFSTSFFPTRAAKIRSSGNKIHLRPAKTKAWAGVLSCDWHTSSLRTAAPGLVSHYQNPMFKRSLQVGDFNSRYPSPTSVKHIPVRHPVKTAPVSTMRTGPVRVSFRVGLPLRWGV